MTPHPSPGPSEPASHPEPEQVSPLEPVPMQPVAPPERRSRAGRNLPVAVAVGLGLGLAILATLYVEKVAFVGLLVLAVGLALSELSNAFTEARVRLPLVPVLVGAGAIVVAAYAGGPEPMLVALFLTVLAVLLWRLPENPSGVVRDVTAGVFATMYVPFLAAFAALLLRTEDGPDRVVVFILLTVLSDTGGYVAGVLLGRHPMAPRVSPKKSWEGLAGSAVFSGVGGAVAVPLLVDGGVWQGLVIGLAVMAVATLGDLGESMIKRDLGIKDMGSLLPGHGGVMDRLDSLLLAAPVAYLLLSALVPA